MVAYLAREYREKKNKSSIRVQQIPRVGSLLVTYARQTRPRQFNFHFNFGNKRNLPGDIRVIDKTAFWWNKRRKVYHQIER